MGSRVVSSIELDEHVCQIEVSLRLILPHNRRLKLLNGIQFPVLQGGTIPRLEIASARSGSKSSTRRS